MNTQTKINRNSTISYLALRKTLGILGITLTALIPTAYFEKCKEPLDYTIELRNFCEITELTTQYIHNNAILGGIHFGCAAIFLILMGWMSFDRFTKGNTGPKMKFFYKACAIFMWIPLVCLGVKVVFKIEGGSEYMVLICEWISLFFFGVAWLVKGKTFERFGFH